MLPAVKLVYLTMSTDIEVAAEAFERGASGSLLKTCASAEMVLAVRGGVTGKIVHVTGSLPRRDRMPAVATQETG
jgi:DNA-binding NarL/FixJ family response regulator